MWFKAQNHTLHIAYLDEIFADHTESKQLFEYIMHIMQKKLETGNCGGLGNIFNIYYHNTEIDGYQFYVL